MSPKTVREFFDALPGRFRSDTAAGVNAVYQFDLSGDDGGQYQLHVADLACRVCDGVHPTPNVTLSMAGEDCVAILEGKLSGMSALLNGRLKIAGDMGLAMQLAAFFPDLRPK